MQNLSNHISIAVRSLFSGVMDLIYPPICLCCEQRLEEYEKELCTSCLSNFKLLGKTHSKFSVPGEIYLDTAWALFDFDEAFQNLIHHLKYSRRRKSVGVVLDHYQKAIYEQLSHQTFDLVLSIPLHPRKLRERGYNQVDDVSNWLGKLLNAELGSHLVTRIKYTRSQTQLNAAERSENVAKAFKVSDPSKIENRQILLVDDVLTTGATANALAAVLREAGAGRIDLLTLSTPKF